MSKEEKKPEDVILLEEEPTRKRKIEEVVMSKEEKKPEDAVLLKEGPLEAPFFGLGILGFARGYIRDFNRLFVFTEDGSLLTTKSTLEKIQEFFNETYVLTSLLTATSLDPIKFDLTDTGDHSEANQMILLHAYSMSLIGYIHFCKALKVAVPLKHLKHAKLDAE